MTIRDLPDDGNRRLTVPNLEAALAAGDPAGDAELRPFFDGVRELLERHGKPTDVEVRLVTGAEGIRLELALDRDPMGLKASIPAPADTELTPLAAILVELEAMLLERTEPTAGADSPLTAPTGEVLLDEKGYAGMRAAVLNVSQALGAIEPGLFDALVATAERSIGPGLDQAVAAGDIPLDQLGSARDALELELRLFRLARSFRQGIASVQDEVRRHVKAEEERAGAPPAIEVIRHNAGRNGGGT